MCSCKRLSKLTDDNYYKSRIQQSNDLRDIIELGLELQDKKILYALINDDRFNNYFTYSKILRFCIQNNTLEVAEKFIADKVESFNFDLIQYKQSVNIDIIRVLQNIQM